MEGGEVTPATGLKEGSASNGVHGAVPSCGTSCACRATVSATEGK